MSVWRTVWLTGSVEPFELGVLEEWVPEIDGRQDWVAPEMDILGRVRGELDEVLDHFHWMVAAAPSLHAVAHLSPICMDRGVEHTVTIGMMAVICGGPVVDALRQP